MINLGKSTLLTANSSINLWIVLILPSRKQILVNAFDQIARLVYKKRFLLSNLVIKCYAIAKPLFINFK